MIYCIVDEVSKIDRFGEILIKIAFSQVVNQLKSNKTVHAKSLTVTNHGLAMRVLLPSLQCAPETKR